MTDTLIPQLPEVRPGARAWLAMTVAEAKMVARDTGGLVIPLGMPLLILVMNGIAFDTDEVIPGTGGRTAFDLYVLPMTLTLVIATVGVINMPSFVAGYRRTGILRRLGVTPASPAMVLVAQAAVGIVQIALGIAIALTLALTTFDANPPAHLWAALGVLCLAVASMYAVGMLVAAVAPTPQSALALGLIAFFAMAAVGGMFGPRENLPDVLAEVGGVLPFGAAVDALGAAWAGQAVPGQTLVGMATATVAAGAGAALWFRWE
ncbi:ABC transporter permease [Isoptericola halotolerans]|uniref:ABC-2 type transport system permease protein n=1 Tax=Isoptericola halotolerans TaxID=300560 RepID=A0ABX2A8K1_9MICO|nr:ABC transporter permease [Isoptericola halotolerans]NOV98966.1 ABC-2 type transport system permease protein [Isoptericola halotolerans]